MLGDELGECDEAAGLQCGLAAIGNVTGSRRVSEFYRPTVAPVSQEEALLPGDCVRDPTKAKGDDVAADDGDGAELEQLAHAPYPLEVPACQREGDDRDEELEKERDVSPHDLTARPPSPTSIALISISPAVKKVHGYLMLADGTRTSHGSAVYGTGPVAVGCRDATVRMT